MTKKEFDELSAKYRLVFGNNIGMEVLADILTMTHFGASLKTDIQMYEHNLGVLILAKMGVFSADNRMDVVKSLMSVAGMGIIPKPNNKEE